MISELLLLVVVVLIVVIGSVVEIWNYQHFCFWTYCREHCTTSLGWRWSTILGEDLATKICPHEHIDGLLAFFGDNWNGLLRLSAIWNCCKICPTWSTSEIGRMMWPLLITISLWNVAKYWEVKSFFRKRNTQLKFSFHLLTSEILSTLALILSSPLTISGTSYKK